MIQANSHGATLVCAFDGWNDACQAATGLIRHLVAAYDAQEIRHIQCDGFYDYQVARPMLCHAAGSARIIWPQTTFYDIALPSGRHLYAQIAPEPNYRWLEYCQQSLHIAEELDIEHIVTLGSMFAECPHTRPLPVEQVRPASGDTVGYGSDNVHMPCPSCKRDPHDGPIGITTVLDTMAAEEGFDATSLWVSIPQYLGNDDCPLGSLRMLRALSSLTGLGLDESHLVEEAKQWEAKAAMLTTCNEDLKDYVHHLEQQYDKTSGSQSLVEINKPQADQLVREAEEFLERQNKNKKD